MECGKIATMESIWGFERIYQCEQHAQQLETVGRAIGINTNRKMIITDKLCKSQVKETPCDNSK